MKKRTFKSFPLFVVIFLVFNYLSISSQTNSNLNFSNISTDDGLSNNFINDIIQDKDGFLWIATNDGLCRYEARNRLNIYKANHPDFPNGLKSNRITVLFEDSNDNLWVGTRLGGLTRWQKGSGTLKTFTHDPSDPNSISNDEILCIIEDKKGRIWVGTENGLNVFDPSTELLHRFYADSDDPNSLNSKAVLSIIEDDKGWIWVGTWGGGLHLLLQSENGSIENSHFKRITLDQNKESQNVWKIYQDNQKRYWMGTFGSGLFLMQLPPDATNLNSHQNWHPKFHNFSVNGNHSIMGGNDFVQDILQDRKGNLWVGTKQGLSQIKYSQLPDSYQYSFPTDHKPEISFSHFRYDPVNPKSLTNDNVRTIYEDTQGIIWIGTASGVNKYNWATSQFDNRNLFDHFSHMENGENLYVDNNGTTWIAGGEKGLLKYNYEKDEITSFKNVNNLLLSDEVNSIYCPDDIHLYVGTGLGVSIINRNTMESTHLPIPLWIKKQFKNFVILSIFKDSKNRIWVATEFYLFLINEKGKYFSLKHDPNDPNSISDNSITDIFEDSHGDIWLTSYNGLSRVKESFSGKITFEQYKPDPIHPEKSISSNQLISIEESNNILYIGTFTGLLGYDLLTKEFINFSKNGNKVFIHSISKTNNDDLWMSTNQGILFFNTKQRIFNSFQRKDGIEYMSFFNNSNCQDSSGFLYFGSRSGITRFHPDHIVANTTPPPIFITDATKMSQSKVTNINTLFKDTLVLKHDEYYLSLKYAVLNYNRSEKNQYAYILEGLDENWTFKDANTSVVYTNLKHGTYTFRVKAANNDGIWNELGKTITIIKKPAFWETWWFQMLCFLAATVTIVFAFKYYSRNIKHRNLTLQRYNENLNVEISERKKIEIALQNSQAQMEGLVEKRTKELQEKKEELKSLLTAIKIRNEELEDIVEKRTEKLKQSNQELVRSNRDLEEFAYIASHDLQEPLRVVGNFVGLLKKRYEGKFDEAAIEYIDFAVDGVDRMSKLIRNLLVFSKVGRKGMDFKITNLNNLLEIKLLDLSQIIKERNVDIQIDTLPSIYCEKNQLGMAFYNLINNAIKFNTQSDPTVKISIHEDAPEGFWKFSVTDNGIGIEPEYQEKIFEIFRRLHKRQEFEGTGIGLALCKKIINSHSGKIWIESVLGQGTTFFFTISKNLNSNYKQIEKKSGQDTLVHEMFN